MMSRGVRIMGGGGKDAVMVVMGRGTLGELGYRGREKKSVS
jgi:hypothetical protein